jgi:predicted transcriptional regulator
MYSKLRDEKVVDHKTRGEIIHYIAKNPGSHFREIKGALKLKNGTLSYHVKVLENNGYVKSRTDGMYKRFYPFGYRIPDVTLSNTERRIIAIIGDNPGITQKAISDEMKITQPAVAYHIKKLKKKGIVESSRRWGCRLTEAYSDDNTEKTSRRSDIDMVEFQSDE